MKSISFIIAIISVCIASCSQILLKKGAEREYGKKIKEYLNPYVITGYGLLCLSMILTIIAYKNLSYLTVSVVEAMGFIIVPLLSIYFFKERISVKKFVGIIFILSGVILYNC